MHTHTHTELYNKYTGVTDMTKSYESTGTVGPISFRVSVIKSWMKKNIIWRPEESLRDSDQSQSPQIE